jgi:uroporphyrinogen-III synthase
VRLRAAAADGRGERACQHGQRTRGGWPASVPLPQRAGGYGTTAFSWDLSVERAQHLPTGSDDNQIGNRLLGRRIAIPEHRDLERLVLLLERQGATVVSYTLTTTRDAPDPVPVLAWLRGLMAGVFDDVIFLTGEGVARLVDLSERAGLKGDVLAALGRVYKIARGPKPARVLSGLGLPADLGSPAPSMRAFVEMLRERPFGDRRVGLQLFGEDPADELVAVLEAKGALLRSVAPYRYAPVCDDDVTALTDELARGELHGIGFAVPGEVDQLFAAARRRGREDSLRDVLARVHVSALSPAVVPHLHRLRLRVDTVLARERSGWRLAPATLDLWQAQVILPHLGGGLL